MELPLQVTYRGLEPTAALGRLIHKEAGKLDRFARIASCRVLVDRELRHIRSGAPYRVRIDLKLPGKELTVDTARSLHALAVDLPFTVREAFRRARRRVRDYATERRAVP